LLTTTLAPSGPQSKPTSIEPRPGPLETLDGPTLLARHLDTVNDAIRLVCKRRCLTVDAAEELAAAVYLKLLQKDGATLRAFRGESSLRTYLVVVVRRVLMDDWIARSGKWRPSSEARQLGKVAVELERRVYREKMSLSEASQTIRHAMGLSHTDDELEFLLSLLPVRPVRRFVSDRDLTRLPSLELDPLESLIRRSTLSVRVTLKDAIATLSDEERGLLRLRFKEGLTVREIAGLRGVDHKGLYRRFDRILRHLRAHMEPGSRSGSGRRLTNPTVS
jgi:RNA polymerase sigma factor (sigma-70 family)